MKSKILGYIFLVLVFAGIVAGVYYWKYGNRDDRSDKYDKISQRQTDFDASVGAGETTDWKTYRNRVFGYEFRYPPNVNFQENEADATQASVYFDKALVPQTDFGHAEFQVYANPGVKTEANCISITYSNPVLGEKPAGKKVISGTTFVEGGSSGAAAGTYVQEKVYRAFRNGSCYDLTERLFTYNIQVYDNWQERGLRYMTESEKQLVWDKLDKILSTFKFIDNELSVKGTLLIYDTLTVIAGFKPQIWYLVPRDIVWPGSPKANVELIFTGSSVCYKPKDQFTVAFEFKCNGSKIKWGYGDRVRIVGTKSSNSIIVSRMEIVSTLPIEQW